MKTHNTHYRLFSGKSNSSFFPAVRRRAITSVAVAAIIATCAVAVFASIGFVLKWGTPGLGDGQFSTPRGMAVDSAGNVYVAEGNGNRFQKFDGNGNFLMKAGIPGDVPGGFITPSGIAVDSAGNIYVTDDTTARTSKFNAAGVFQYSIGPGNFLAPSGVACDSADNVYTFPTPTTIEFENTILPEHF